MTYNIFKIIALILNWSPFLHISKDSNFGSVDNLSEIRFSFLAIPLGNNKYYLLSVIKDTITHKWKIEIYKRLKFYDICKRESQNEIDRKTIDYKNTIRHLSDKNIDIMIDFLKEKYNQNENRKSTVYNKMNNYAAINLAHITFIGYLLTELSNIKNHNHFFYIFLIAFILSCLYTLNYSLFIKFGLSIKNFARSSFKDLKANPISKELAACYYTDWYSSKNEVHIISSIVYNIEEYCIRGITSSVLLWILILTNASLQNKISSTTSGYVNDSIIVSKTNCLFNNFF